MTVLTLLNVAERLHRDFSYCDFGVGLKLMKMKKQKVLLSSAQGITVVFKFCIFCSVERTLSITINEGSGWCRVYLYFYCFRGG